MLSAGQLRATVDDPVTRWLEGRTDSLHETRVEICHPKVGVVQRKRVVHDQAEVAAKARSLESHVGVARQVPAFPANPVKPEIQRARSIHGNPWIDPPEICGSDRRSAKPQMKIVRVDVVKSCSGNAAVW